MVVVDVLAAHVRGFAVEPEEWPFCRCRGRRSGRCGDVKRVLWLPRTVDLNVMFIWRFVVGHFEDHLHIVGGTASTNTPVKILRCRG